MVQAAAALGRRLRCRARVACVIDVSGGVAETQDKLPLSLLDQGCLSPGCLT